LIKQNEHNSVHICFLINQPIHYVSVVCNKSMLPVTGRITAVMNVTLRLLLSAGAPEIHLTVFQCTG
ncbi:hypothetical protein, partial [Escherichia coli]|uniref:hypothetical protein n=1 Tax=Escherichia coli TaxID=562 RepID=UPI001F43AAFA